MSSQRDEFLKIFNSIEFNEIKDHPNILIAANFWEPDRYKAAAVFYRFMRRIDDLIDDYKASHKVIAPSERDQFVIKVNEWLKLKIDSDDYSHSKEVISHTIEKFRIPIWPVEDFARSMIYDIYNDGFSSLESFLEYSRGASVAPASIFVHLNGLIKKDGRYEDPVFDVREAATPCAMFSYLVHIIRDFQKDQLNNLSCFSDDLLKKYNLSRFDMKEIAYGHPVSSNFRRLMKHYYILADEYRRKTYEVLEKILPLHNPRYQLSLQIIFNLYLMVFERIDIENGNFNTEELNPTAEEIKQRVYDTIINFCN